MAEQASGAVNVVVRGPTFNSPMDDREVTEGIVELSSMADSGSVSVDRVNSSIVGESLGYDKRIFKALGKENLLSEADDSRAQSQFKLLYCATTDEALRLKCLIGVFLLIMTGALACF